MKEEKIVVSAGTTEELRPDEQVVIFLQGTVDKTKQLGHGMTEIIINVDSVNGSSIPKDEYFEWFPLKVASPLYKRDKIGIRVAVVNPTSTADDVITVKIDQVEPIDGVPFADVAFFAENIESLTSCDGSFYTILPAGKAWENEKICLRFELIQPESDETDEVVLTGEVVENFDEVHTHVSGFTDVQINMKKAHGNDIPDDVRKECYFPLPDYPELGTKVTFRIIPNASAPGNDKQTLINGKISCIKDDGLNDLGLNYVCVDVDSINGENPKDERYVMAMILPTSFKLKKGDKFQFSFEVINNPEQ